MIPKAGGDPRPRAAGRIKRFGTANAASMGFLIVLCGVGPYALADTDLEVTYIERNPKYYSYQDHVRYHINVTFYDDYLPYSIDVAYGLSGQNENTRRWPADGETVSFTAHVYNRGTQRVNSFDYRWFIDDMLVESGTWARPLAPGETALLSHDWTWEFAPHRVRFEAVLPEDDHPSNNTVEDFTHALSLFSFIDQGYAAQFRLNTGSVPNPSTDSIREWLQRHRARMNEMFAQAGSPLRWRYDRLDFVPDGEPLPPYDRANYDGNFPTRFRVGDPDLRLGGSGYYDADGDIDYGLLHEIGHQLGIIDLYRINVSPQQNQVNASGYSTTVGLMNGVSRFISAHTGGAMASWHGKRRGYFGQYLFDLPVTIRLRFLDTLGDPLSGAQISVFQKIETDGIGERIPNVVKFAGVTDEKGIYTLPNVQVDNSMFWTDVGSDLRPNPFGYISNHGENGVFLIRVEANEMVDYVWFDITEPNLAYWSGQTDEATFDRQTAIGRGRQHFPPADMAEMNAASWARWAQSGTIELIDDPDFKRAGQASIRIEATGGADNYVRYPGDTLAKWNLSQVQSIRFSLFGQNNSPNGFQYWSVRLGNYIDGYIEWSASSDVLNAALGRWVDYAVPISGGSVWQRSDYGTPDLSEINYFELHVDTWDAGFTLWMDDVRFDPPPRPEVGDVNCDGAIDAFDVEAFLLALFDPDEYASRFPDCDINLADVNADGTIDAFDIEPFLDLLFP